MTCCSFEFFCARNPSIVCPSWRDLLVEKIDRADQRLLTLVELLALTGQDLRDLLVGCAIKKFGRKLDRLGAALLAAEARLERKLRVELGAQPVDGGARLRLVQRQENVAACTSWPSRT